MVSSASHVMTGTVELATGPFLFTLQPLLAVIETFLLALHLLVTGIAVPVPGMGLEKLYLILRSISDYGIAVGVPLSGTDSIRTHSAVAMTIPCLRQSIAFSCPDRYRKSCVRISRLSIPGQISVRPIHAFGTKAVFARQKCSGKDTEYFNTLPEYPKPACYCSS